jgi:hypothetical protein|tara:strand:- start:274 stop:654 length:381 start_codon:yes stop_codon:yes gene_type:complete
MDMNWKRFERRVAEISGGKRIPVNGRKELDVKHPYLGIECKYRKTLPDWLFKHAWGQAVSGSSIDQIPVICVGQYNSKKTFAVLELKELVKLLCAAVQYEDDIAPWGVPDFYWEEKIQNYGGTDPD